MFSRRDFPDYMTEAAYIRERHGPPPLSAQEIAEREAEARRVEGEIIAAYDQGVSVSAIQKSFQDIGLYRIRQIIAKTNFSRCFEDPASQTSHFKELRNRCCDDCVERYLSGPWRNWIIGKRLTSPDPPKCTHKTP
jgi:hypothetical protein